MRLWSIHPKYLDPKGLVALWRESLLAKRVLQGKTSSYKNHPQLARFKEKPISFINTYLAEIYRESCKRGYCFDKRRLSRPYTKAKIHVNKGQIEYEFLHLKKKLRIRNKKKFDEISKTKKIFSNRLFRIKKGPVEPWEKT